MKQYILLLKIYLGGGSKPKGLDIRKVVACTFPNCFCFHIICENSHRFSLEDLFEPVSYADDCYIKNKSIATKN